jgi:hypothetical protein
MSADRPPLWSEEANRGGGRGRDESFPSPWFLFALRPHVFLLLHSFIYPRWRKSRRRDEFFP